MRRVDAKRMTWTRPASEGVQQIYSNRPLSQTDRRTAQEIDESAGIKVLGVKSQKCDRAYLKIVTAKGTSCPVHAEKRQQAIGRIRIV